jgi:hypothetical protein
VKFDTRDIRWRRTTMQVTDVFDLFSRSSDFPVCCIFS